MHGELSIRHEAVSAEQLAALLTPTFGVDDRTALDRSVQFSSGWSDQVTYCRATPRYILVAFQVSARQTQIHLEPVDGNFLETCQVVFSEALTALKSLLASMESFYLVESGRQFFSARTGLRAEVLREAVIVPVLVAIASIAYALYGIFTFAQDTPGKFMQGVVAGVVTAVVMLAISLYHGSRAKLRWSKE